MENMKIIGILAILAGILVIFVPDILGWIVGIFLIIYGVVKLLDR
ncbi:DUF3096 domain-containing protein [Methanobrevibacter sp. OttesenSCG-928-I08]|nr:DUF3096 domain-containing protein [Methanobrevibacter sp. OttesenSCG-928-I08]